MRSYKYKIDKLKGAKTNYPGSKVVNYITTVEGAPDC